MTSSTYLKTPEQIAEEKKAKADKEKNAKKFDYSKIEKKTFLYGSNKILWKKWVRAKMKLFFIVR